MVVDKKFFGTCVACNSCDRNLFHLEPAQMASIDTEGRKIAAKHAYLWVVARFLGGLRRGLRCQYSRHRDGDPLQQDILDCVIWNSSNKNSHPTGVLYLHVTDHNAGQCSRAARYIS